MKTPLTAERLREVLDYCPETGVFVWRVDNGRKGKAGQFAGCISGNYRRITIDGIAHQAHWLAWMFVHGIFPPNGYIDHANGNGLDNRIANLRDVSNGENMQNQRVAHKNSKTGLLGVRLNKASGNYVATVTVNGEVINIGSYKTAEEAHAAYLHAKQDTHTHGMLQPITTAPPEKLPKRPSSTGFTGVELNKRTGRFRAFFTVERTKKVHVGYFDTAAEASEAREKAKTDHFNRKTGVKSP